MHYLFTDLQIFNIIPCPRRTLQGTIITIQFFGGSETTAGPANHHGNTPVSTGNHVNRKNLYIHVCSLFALNLCVIHWLADGTIRAQVEVFSISFKIPPPHLMFPRSHQAGHRQGERLLGKGEHCQALAHNSTCFALAASVGIGMVWRVCDPFGSIGPCTQKRLTPGLILCWHHLEILNNLWTRGLTCPFCSEPHELCSMSCVRGKW